MCCAMEMTRQIDSRTPTSLARGQIAVRPETQVMTPHNTVHQKQILASHNTIHHKPAMTNSSSSSSSSTSSSPYMVLDDLVRKAVRKEWLELDYGSQWWTNDHAPTIYANSKLIPDLNSFLSNRLTELKPILEKRPVATKKIKLKKTNELTNNYINNLVNQHNETIIRGSSGLKQPLLTNENNHTSMNKSITQKNTDLDLFTPIPSPPEMKPTYLINGPDELNLQQITCSTINSAPMIAEIIQSLNNNRTVSNALPNDMHYNKQSSISRLNNINNSQLVCNNNININKSNQNIQQNFNIPVTSINSNDDNSLKLKIKLNNTKGGKNCRGGMPKCKKKDNKKNTTSTTTTTVAPATTTTTATQKPKKSKATTDMPRKKRRIKFKYHGSKVKPCYVKLDVLPETTLMRYTGLTLNDLKNNILDSKLLRNNSLITNITSQSSSKVNLPTLNGYLTDSSKYNNLDTIIHKKPTTTTLESVTITPVNNKQNHTITSSKSNNDSIKISNLSVDEKLELLKSNLSVTRKCTDTKPSYNNNNTLLKQMLKNGINENQSMNQSLLHEQNKHLDIFSSIQSPPEMKPTHLVRTQVDDNGIDSEAETVILSQKSDDLQSIEPIKNGDKEIETCSNNNDNKEYKLLLLNTNSNPDKILQTIDQKQVIKNGSNEEIPTVPIISNCISIGDDKSAILLSRSDDKERSSVSPLINSNKNNESVSNGQNDNETCSRSIDMNMNYTNRINQRQLLQTNKTKLLKECDSRDNSDSNKENKFIETKQYDDNELTIKNNKLDEEPPLKKLKQEIVINNNDEQTINTKSTTLKTDLTYMQIEKEEVKEETILSTAIIKRLNNDEMKIERPIVELIRPGFKDYTCTNCDGVFIHFHDWKMHFENGDPKCANVVSSK